jgi:hypothetical protein
MRGHDRLLSIRENRIVNVMSKSVPAPCRERWTTEDLDQGLSNMLDSLRKPLKLTATLKRRALKNKAGEKSADVKARPATEA